MKRSFRIQLVAALLVCGCKLPEIPVDPSDLWRSLGCVSEESAGEPFLSSGNSIAIDSADNRPVVAISDGGRVRVQKWSEGTTWIDLAYPVSDFSSSLSLAIDPSDSRPVVAIVDATGNARVLKWAGGSAWTDLGYPRSDLLGKVGLSQATGPALAIDPTDDKPVVVLTVFEGGTFIGIQALKWSAATEWTDLGYPCPGEGSDPCLAIDPSDGRPVVAFTAGHYDYVAVAKWAGGTTWTDLGAPLPGEGENASLAVDPLDGKPVVVARCSDPVCIRAWRWSAGTAWTDLGQVSTGGDWPAVAVEPSGGGVVVVFYDEQTGGRARVVRRTVDGAWTHMGYASAGEAGYPAIALDPSNGNPVVLFSDGANGWRALVMRYEP